MQRLAALEAEVKAESDAQRARKAAAIAKLRDPRVTKSPGDAPSGRTRSAPASEPPRPRRGAERSAERSAERLIEDDAGHLEDLGGALELASKANRVRQELARKPGKGEKSWMMSGLLSLGLGPAGWLYAGSMREAIPAAAGTLLIAALVSKILPMVLLMPALLVVAPLSAIAGVMYALRYNRVGKRQRLFDGKKEKAALPAGASASARRNQLRDGT